MKRPSILKLILSYIKDHRKLILAAIIMAITFTIVLILHNLPFNAVAYGILLCGAISFFFILYDFYLYWKRYIALEALKYSITLSLDDIPTAKNRIEEDYQALLTVLYNDKTVAINTMNTRNDDLFEYVTLWVHQIKTPVSAMHLLLQTDEFPENPELVLELFKIEQYIEMILQYIRLDNISSDLLLKHYSLDNIVRQAIRKYSKLFISQKISLNFSQLNATVLTDEKWLVFVIEQLLSNALKYTHKGSIAIYMHSSKSKTLIIEDTGIGIQAEDLPRIFEKGFTGYNGRRDKRSTGIGLYLCKRILTKLSHTITIESQTELGSKVMIDLETVDMGPLD